VGLGRLELPTSPLSGVRSSHLSYRPGHWQPGLPGRCVGPILRPRATPIVGGAGRDRTGDLLNANQALSQLSYSPCLGTRDLGLGIGKIPNPNPQSPAPNFVIEADWTLPADAWPYRQSKSQNSKWRFRDGFGLERLLLTDHEAPCFCSRLGFSPIR
jgi:hypothetical protein